MALMGLAACLSSSERGNGACGHCSVNTNRVISITTPIALVIICFNVYDFLEPPVPQGQKWSLSYLRLYLQYLAT